MVKIIQLATRAQWHYASNVSQYWLKAPAFCTAVFNELWGTYLYYMSLFFNIPALKKEAAAGSHFYKREYLCPKICFQLRPHLRVHFFLLLEFDYKIREILTSLFTWMQNSKEIWLNCGKSVGINHPTSLEIHFFLNEFVWITIFQLTYFLDAVLFSIYSDYWCQCKHNPRRFKQTEMYSKHGQT